MGGKRTVELGAGADRLERRRTSRLLLATLIVLVGSALMVLGAFLVEFVADLFAIGEGVTPLSWLVFDVPRWAVEIAVWLATLVVVGTVLILIQRRYGTVLALLALVVLMGVAMSVLAFEELVVLVDWRAW